MHAPQVLSPELLAVIVCPDDHQPLLHDTINSTLRCVHCKKVFPVEKGIPTFLKSV